MSNICFLQVKSFGDLVIANTVVKRINAVDWPRLTFAVGHYLLPLCDAITPTIKVIELATGETSVPSIFDVRRNGIAAALKSAWQIRRAIARAPIAYDALILLDRVGLRERFLIGNRPIAPMTTDSENIYVRYDELLTCAGFILNPIPLSVIRNKRRVGIFPSSRISSKNLPIDLITEVMHECIRRDFQVELFILEGERPDLEESGLPYTILPRLFSALLDTMSEIDIVISADSLPAHIAESIGVDIFVLTPRYNLFWMPYSVFKKNQWCLFNDSDCLNRIGKFLIC